MSGLYIPGLDIPNKKHGAVFILYPDGTVAYDGVAMYKAIPVPDHGRLIDGDRLADGCDEPYWCRWLSEIEDAPTIIPGEEKT